MNQREEDRLFTKAMIAVITFTLGCACVMIGIAVGVARSIGG